MINRITEIKNVGKFIDAHIGAKSFFPYTIIFGNNTNGKSTLTDIFRSLKLGNPSIIKGRKTFGQIGEQKIKIVFEGNKVIEYPSAQWMNGYEDIEIFDENFITDNIFQGEGVEFEHQKRLNHNNYRN